VTIFLDIRYCMCLVIRDRNSSNYITV